MKVLYFIPKTKDDSLSFFRKGLVECVADVAEVHVVTPRTDEGLHIGGIKVHYLSAYPLMIRRNRKRFDKIVRSLQPDIIHVIGAWNFTASCIERWARTYRIPVVMSPLKGFAPWNMSRSYWLCRLPRLLLFQKSMVTHVHALHAVGRQEHDFIKNVGFHPSLHHVMPWNSRIAVIENPEFTDRTDTVKTANAMLGLYNKVADSNPFMLMTDDDRARENTLLRVGLSHDTISAAISDDNRRLLASMSDASWRRILLHSADEGIANAVIRGALAMQLNRKSIVIDNTGRFENTRKREKGTLKEMRTPVKRRALESLKDKFGARDNELGICRMILNIMYMLDNGTLCRVHLAELYTATRFDNYNESVVRLMLKRLNAMRPAARLMRIMGDTLGLEEGFMPVEPLNDKGTDNIRETLFKLKIQ